MDTPANFWAVVLAAIFLFFILKAVKTGNKMILIVLAIAGVITVILSFIFT